MAKVQGWTETSVAGKTALGLTRPMIAMVAVQTRQCQCKALWLCIRSLGLQIRTQSWARLPKPFWGDKALVAPWVSSELWDDTRHPSGCTGGVAHTEHTGVGAMLKENQPCWSAEGKVQAKTAMGLQALQCLIDLSLSRNAAGRGTTASSTFVQSRNRLWGEQSSRCVAGHGLGLEVEKMWTDQVARMGCFMKPCPTYHP